MKNVLDLRPSQFTLGMVEVQNKVKKINKMTSSQKKKYIESHRVPVVVANGSLYIVDHHHFVRACWEAGINKVHTEIISVRPVCSNASLWNFMISKKWAYLVDSCGRDSNPEFLPVDVRGMADDPYRSLAWAVREAGGFNKVDVPFSEFRWAYFLRKYVSISDIRNNFKEAVKEALKVCSSKEAAKFPGYKGA